MITNVCYLAIVGLTTSEGEHGKDRRYWAQLNGGHVAELSSAEYAELEDYLEKKNNIERDKTWIQPVDEPTSAGLKRKFGRE